MSRHYLAYRPVHADDLTRRQYALESHDVIELQILPFGHSNPEFERCGIAGSENPSHCIGHGDRE